MATAPSASILVVDDDRFIRELLRRYLSAQGHSVLEASDGDQALATVTAHKPSLVLLDLFMPHRSGLEIIPEIKRASPETRILVLSSLDTATLVDQALQNGASGFISKPFHRLEIIEAVQKALAS